MARMKARDVMTRAVLSVGPEASLLDAARLFVEEGIHGAPVVGDQGELLGVVTTSDLLRAQEEERDTAWAAGEDLRALEELGAAGEQPGQRTVGEVMTKAFVSVGADAPVSDVARTLRENQIHRVWIEEAGQLCGVVSALDLMPVIESADR